MMLLIRRTVGVLLTAAAWVVFMIGIAGCAARPDAAVIAIDPVPAVHAAGETVAAIGAQVETIGQLTTTAQGYVGQTSILLADAIGSLSSGMAAGVSSASASLGHAQLTNTQALANLASIQQSLDVEREMVTRLAGLLIDANGQIATLRRQHASDLLDANHATDRERLRADKAEATIGYRVERFIRHVFWTAFIAVVIAILIGLIGGPIGGMIGGTVGSVVARGSAGVMHFGTAGISYIVKLILKWRSAARTSP